MTDGLKSLTLFVVVLLGWVLVPLLPAWLTFRITPDQRINVKGPLQGLTVRSGGAFAAYMVVFLAIAAFVWQAGSALIGIELAAGTWTVSGNVLIVDSEGKPMQLAPPGLAETFVRLRPEPNSFTPERVSLEIPLRGDRETVVYLEVPSWGGGRIILADSAIERNPLLRRIQLKNLVILRQQATRPAVVGEIRTDAKQ